MTLPDSLAKKRDELHKAGFDHPCRDRCTGWQQGFDRGQDSMQERCEELRQANERLVKALADIRMIEALYQVGVNIKGESRIGRIAREAIAANPAPQNVVGSKE